MNPNNEAAAAVHQVKVDTLLKDLQGLTAEAAALVLGDVLGHVMAIAPQPTAVYTMACTFALDTHRELRRAATAAAGAAGRQISRETRLPLA